MKRNCWPLMSEWAREFTQTDKLWKFDIERGERSQRNNSILLGVEVHRGAS